LDGVVEEAQRLLERGQRVPGVQLVEVDVVDAEPAQGVVECAPQVATGGADGVGVLAHREATLGGEDDAVALRPSVRYSTTVLPSPGSRATLPQP
jgi:hypothetical protein